MLAQQVHVVGAVAKHGFAPLARSADADELDRRIDLPHGLGEFVVLPRVLLQGHMAELPVAVHLVADAPELHAVGLGMAVLGPQLAHGRVGRTVGVLDLFDGRFRIAQPAVDGDVRLGLQVAAKDHELVQAEVVVLDAVPGRVLARRTAVAVADAVRPVIAADEVSTRPTVDRRIQLLQEGQGVGPHAMDVVGGHEGDRADGDGTLADGGDLQPAVVGGSAGREFQRRLVNLSAGLSMAITWRSFGSLPQTRLTWTVPASLAASQM